MEAGCSFGGEETPEPTGWRPRLLRPFVIATSGADQVTLVGPPDVVDPGGLDVVGLNLDTVEPPVTVESASDGSFQITINGQLTDGFRLVAQGGGVHSRPIDVTGPTTSTPSCISGVGVSDAACADAGDEGSCWGLEGCLWSWGSTSRVETSEIPECLQFGPRRWMSFGAHSMGEDRTMSFQLINSCDEAVSVMLTRRSSTPSFSLGEAIEEVPVVVEPEGSTSLGVTFSPERAGELEEVILVEILEPDIGRWAISLWGEGL